MTEPIKGTRGDEVWFSFTLEPGLEEDLVWSATVLPLLEGLPANDIDIWQYCVTEMVNNVIDHSDGSRLALVVRRRPLNTLVQVLDDGIGIFRSEEHTSELQSLR